MFRIKMLVTRPVAVDGIHTKLLVKDQEYGPEDGVDKDLFDLLVNRMKVAKAVRAPRERIEPSENQTVEPSEKKESASEKPPETEPEDPPEDEDEDESKDSSDGILVYELAREIKVPSGAIIKVAKKMGLKVVPASKLTLEQVDEIKEEFTK